MDDRSAKLGAKIDKFAERYKLWLVIPLVTSALTALASLRAGIGMLIFFISIWVFVQIVEKILSIAERLLPNDHSLDDKKALQEAGSATLFLGGLAIVGIVLRGENLLSRLVQENMPSGMSLSFIDPTFAIIVLVCVWIYTGYRVKR